MILEALKAKKEIIPPVRIPEKRYEQLSATLRIGEADPFEVKSYSIQMSSDKYAPFMQQLGLIKIAERAYQCTSTEHLRFFTKIASDRAIKKLREAFPDILTHNPTIYRSAPALHYDGESYVFIASKAAQAWVSDAGWEFDQKSGVYKTQDPLQASALYAFATNEARAKIRLSVTDEKFISYVSKNPVAGPWATIGLQKKTAVIYAGIKNEKIYINAGLLKNKPWGRFATFDAQTAQPFFPLVPDKQTRIIYGKMPEDAQQSQKLIELDNIKISDLLEIIESPKGAGSKKKNEKAEEILRLDYDRRKSGWLTRNPKAKHVGFEDLGDGSYFTKNPETAANLRSKASMLAEIYIQISVAKQIEKNIPSPWEVELAEPPEGLKYFDDQREGILFQALRPHSINSDDMGTGKTVQAAGLVATLRPKRSLHIVLPPILPSYERHMHAWIKDPMPVNIVKKKEKIQDGITISPASQFFENKNILEEDWDMVFVDEHHRFKNINSQRANALYSINTKRSADYSGTPIPNRPQDLFNTLHAKLPQVFSSREMFMRLYGVNQLTIEDPKVEQQKRLLRNLLGSIMRRTIMIRRHKNLAVKKYRKTIELKINDPELDKLLAAENTLLTKLITSKKQTEKIRLLAEISELRVQTAKFKIKDAVQHTIASIHAGNVPLIFANFREIIGRTHQELKNNGYNFLVITGESGTPKQRQDEIDLFQKGKYDGVIASFKAGGTGLTMTRANHVISIELDWDPYDMLQAEDRAYRTGQLRDVYIDYLVIARSVDNYIATNNNLKIRNVDDILIPTLDDDLDAIAFQIDENLDLIEKKELDFAA